MSTLLVDRISPYQSASVTIDGLSAPNLATTGSNTFVGSQNIQGTITASIAQGFALVGGVGNVSTLVATSSFGGSGAGFPFTGNAVITGSLTISGSATNDLTVIGNTFVSGNITADGPTSQIQNQGQGNAQYMTVGFGGAMGVGSTSNLTEIGLALDGATWTTNWANGPLIYVNNTPGDTYEGVFGFQNKANYTDGRITALKPLVISGSTSISGTLAINNDIFVSSSDIFLTGSGGSYVNIFTNSPGDPTSAIRFYSGSTIGQTGRGGQIKVAGGGTSINIGSFGAGENSLVDFDFIGLQTLFSRNVSVVGNSVLNISSGSSSGNYRHNGITFTKTSGTASLFTGEAVSLFGNNRYVGELKAAHGFEHFNGNNNSYINLNVDNAAYGNSGWAGPGLAVSNADLSDYPVVIGLQAGNTYTDGTVTILKPLDVSGSVSVAPTFQLQLPTGSNQQVGTATLDGGNPGTVTVSNSLVNANSIILVTKQTFVHSGVANVSSKGSGTFTITSTANGDTDVVGYMIINNS